MGRSDIRKSIYMKCRQGATVYSLQSSLQSTVCSLVYSLQSSLQSTV
jgi:hypothetical protein